MTAITSLQAPILIQYANSHTALKTYVHKCYKQIPSSLCIKAHAFFASHLLAAVTLIRLLTAVNTLVSLQVVALDKPHITHITTKWLFP